MVDSHLHTRLTPGAALQHQQPLPHSNSTPALPTILLQALGPGDRFRIHDHLRALSAEDRMLRFGHGISDAGLVRYVATLDFRRDYVAGLRCGTDIVALAHAGIRDGDADFGLSVATAMRGKGLGQRLFNHVIALAWQAGAQRVLCHSISPAVIHMANRHGFRAPPGCHDTGLLILSRPALASLRPV